MENNAYKKPNVISANVQLLISLDKKLALVQFLKEHTPDIMCINETWLKPSHQF
jgi:exonuclease III